MIDPDQDNAPPKSKQEYQIWVRLQLLRTWKETQIPVEYAHQLPASVRGFGRWDEPKLGIRRLSDPNSLSMQHPTWGWRIREADRLLKALNGAMELPQQKSGAQQQAADLRVGNRELQSMLARAVNQYHQVKETAERAVLDAHYHKQIQKDQAEQIERLTALVDLRDQELAEVRRELSKLKTGIRLHRP